MGPRGSHTLWIGSWSRTRVSQRLLPAAGSGLTRLGRGGLQFSLSHPLPLAGHACWCRGGGREGGGGGEEGERRREGEREASRPLHLSRGPARHFPSRTFFIRSTPFFRQRVCSSARDAPARAGPPPDPEAPGGSVGPGAAVGCGPPASAAAPPGGAPGSAWPPLSRVPSRPSQCDLRPGDSGPPPLASPSLDGRPLGVALGLTRPSVERQLRQPRQPTPRHVTSHSQSSPELRCSPPGGRSRTSRFLSRLRGPLRLTPNGGPLSCPLRRHSGAGDPRAHARYPTQRLGARGFRVSPGNFWGGAGGGAPHNPAQAPPLLRALLPGPLSVGRPGSSSIAPLLSS